MRIFKRKRFNGIFALDLKTLHVSADFPFWFTKNSKTQRKLVALLGYRVFNRWTDFFNLCTERAQNLRKPVEKSVIFNYFCCSEVYTFTSLEVLGALHATQNQIQATSYIFYLIFSIFLRFVSYALTHQITISYWTVFYKQELSEAFFITLTRKNIGPVDLYLKYKVRYILEWFSFLED